MFLAIQMPTWLVDFWTVYGDMITPVLVTVALALLTSLALKIKSDAKTNAAKADLQIQALKDVANREDNKPQLEQQAQEIADLKRVVTHQSEMINLAFQNSNLTPEIKDSLTSLSNKIKYGTEIDVIKDLEAQKAELQQQVDALTIRLSEQASIAAPVVEEVKKRIRR